MTLILALGLPRLRQLSCSGFSLRFAQIFRLFSKIINFSWIFWYEMNALIKRSHLNMFLQVG